VSAPVRSLSHRETTLRGIIFTAALTLVHASSLPAAAAVTTTLSEVTRVQELATVMPGSRGGTVAESTFDSTLMRYTVPPETGCTTANHAARHHYQSMTPEGAPTAGQPDGLLRIDKFDAGSCPRIYLNPKTGAVMFTRKSQGDCRWDPAQPGTEVCVKGNNLNRYNVETGSTSLIAALPSGYAYSGDRGAADLSWGGTAGLSYDGKWTATTAYRSADAGYYVFVWDIANKGIAGQFRLASGCTPSYTFVFPDGSGTVTGCKGDTLLVYAGAAQIGSYANHNPGHGEVAALPNGHAAYFGSCKTVFPKTHPCYRDLVTGEVVDLAPGVGAVNISHVSTEWQLDAQGVPDKITVTHTGSEGDGRLIYHECTELGTGLLSAPISTITRWGHTHSQGKSGAPYDYLGEPHCVRAHNVPGVWFASNWLQPVTGPVSLFRMY
jgi:hypothetical protein